jgi:hypothetical protein
MNVLLVTPWGDPSGIAEHSVYLKAAVEAADPAITITPSYVRSPTVLHPEPVLSEARTADILHLDYHAALHSQWTPQTIRRAQALGYRVVVTYHDTGVPNSEQCVTICDAADAYILHETAGDLSLDGPGYYWRMGVPAWEGPYMFGACGDHSAPQSVYCFKSWNHQPVLGSIGFPFPWKNYDQLARITRKIGWALLLIAPGASPAQLELWNSLNPDLHVRTDFVPRTEAISLLAGCDATAFMYVCHNTGQSAAILQGIATRKPVYALATCRQFRALFDDPLGRTTISWCETFEDLQFNLSHFTPITGRAYAPIVALAEQESWARLGRKYATLYYELERA